MVSTFLSPSDQLLKEQFDQFAKEKLAPLVSALSSGEKETDYFIKLMATSGYLALNVPSEYGGKNAPFLQIILLAECLAHYDAGIAIYLAYHAALIELIKLFGSATQQKIYLPKLASGSWLGTISYLNPAQSEEEISVGQNADKLSLQGTRQMVVSVPENTSKDDDKAINNLVGFFVADKLILLDLADTKIGITESKSILGFKSVRLLNLNFNNYGCPVDSLLSTGTQTHDALNYARDIIKTILAAVSLGMVDSTLKQMAHHTQTSKRAGKPMSESQAVLWQLANAASDTSAARLLTYRAAWSKDSDMESFPKYAAMAKSFAAQTANIHVGKGLQIIPPLLKQQSLDLSAFYTDSKILETFEATIEEEKVLLSALLGI